MPVRSNTGRTGIPRKERDMPYIYNGNTPYIYKGTTPTFIFEFPETFDCTVPVKTALTIKERGGRLLLRKDTPDLIIEAHKISVYLEQAETLEFPDSVRIQINMLFGDGSRVATDEFDFNWRKNQIDEVMT